MMDVEMKYSIIAIISFIFLSTLGSSVVYSDDKDFLSVGCSLSSYFSEPAIKFSSIEGEINPDNYGSAGTLSLIAEMKTKSGNWKKFSVKGEYKKVGKRLELSKTDFVRFDSDLITKEEFKDIFGPLPELKCKAY
tara:strand:- start:64 stop:468 length:405 start_codon:yes stop_codon:yes gene_type:complete